MNVWIVDRSVVLHCKWVIGNVSEHHFCSERCFLQPDMDIKLTPLKPAVLNVVALLSPVLRRWLVCLGPFVCEEVVEFPRCLILSIVWHKQCGCVCQSNVHVQLLAGIKFWITMT